MSEWLDGFNFDEMNSSEGEKINEPMPSDWYVIQIVDTEWKTTKNGKGKYLKLEFEVVEGRYQGRKIFGLLNLVNQNETAVKIAKAELNTIMAAVGIVKFTSSEPEQELLNKPMKGKIKYVPEDGNYDAKNEIKNYKPLNSQASSNGSNSSAPSAPSSPSSPSKPSAPSVPSKPSAPAPAPAPAPASDDAPFDDEPPAL